VDRAPCGPRSQDRTDSRALDGRMPRRTITRSWRSSSTSTSGTSYTAPMSRRPTTPTLLEFLTQTKTGFCQHYASAMAVMVRRWGCRRASGSDSGRGLGRGTAAIPDQGRPRLGRGAVPRHGWLQFEPEAGTAHPNAQAGTYLNPVAGRGPRMPRDAPAGDRMAFTAVLHEETESLDCRSPRVHEVRGRSATKVLFVSQAHGHHGTSELRNLWQQRLAPSSGFMKRCVPHVSRDGPQEGARGWSLSVTKPAGRRHCSLIRPAPETG
jgi:hypothetical protein